MKAVERRPDQAVTPAPAESLQRPPHRCPSQGVFTSDLAGRLSTQVGVKFEFHQLRHTYATGLLRRGVAVEVVSKLLGHRHVTTTIDTYAHLSDTDIRRHLDAVGFFENRVVTL